MPCVKVSNILSPGRSHKQLCLRVRSRRKKIRIDKMQQLSQPADGILRSRRGVLWFATSKPAFSPRAKTLSKQGRWDEYVFDRKQQVVASKSPQMRSGTASLYCQDQSLGVVKTPLCSRVRIPLDSHISA